MKADTDHFVALSEDASERAIRKGVATQDNGSRGCDLYKGRNLPFTIPLYGSHIAFLPILMGLSTYAQQKMMSGGIQQPQQKLMQNFMLVFFFLIFNNFPSGLNLYYTLFNILTIAQQKLLPNKPRS